MSIYRRNTYVPVTHVYVLFSLLHVYSLSVYPFYLLYYRYQITLVIWAQQPTSSFQYSTALLRCNLYTEPTGIFYMMTEVTKVDAWKAYSSSVDITWRLLLHLVVTAVILGN